MASFFRARVDIDQRSVIFDDIQDHCTALAGVVTMFNDIGYRNRLTERCG